MYILISEFTCNLNDCKSPMQRLGKLVDDRLDRRLYFQPRIPAAKHSSSRTDKIPRPLESYQSVCSPTHHNTHTIVEINYIFNNYQC